MARKINKLSARAVETLKAPGRYSDGGNLYLSISDNGGRRWVFMYRRAGKQREMGLGSASRAGISLPGHERWQLRRGRRSPLGLIRWRYERGGGRLTA
jgi:Arm DNA-binding domain